MYRTVFCIVLSLFCVGRSFAAVSQGSGTKHWRRHAEGIAKKVNGIDGVTWKASVYDEFSDISDDDKRTFFLGVLDGKTSDEVTTRPPLSNNAPDDWDWRTGNQSLSTFNKYPNTQPQTKHFSLDPCVFSVTDRVFVHFSEGFFTKSVTSLKFKFKPKSLVPL